ncbi:MAG: hypothetical protein II877_09835 [Synergistaceae bacterium]|nr:hypothetical protein [Synergistaceae bacterium]MBQ7169214.1 hypothetical protein [Synergistaceae bacterium]
MKRIMVCVILLLTAASSYADIEEFRYFSLNIPDGWTANESGDVVSVNADDRSGSLTITVGDPKGESIGGLAVKFSRELNGTSPVSDDEDGWSFECNNGISQAVIAGDEDFYMMIISTGFMNNAETLGEILSSLEMK